MIHKKQIVTLNERKLSLEWTRAIERYGLFSPEANQIRQQLGQLIAKRESEMFTSDRSNMATGNQATGQHSGY